MSAEDDVGYKRPPRHSQFRKGQSGNPSGRPKRRAMLSDVLDKLLLEKVLVAQHGRRKRLSRFEVIFTQIVNKAAKGDTKAIQTLLGLWRDRPFTERVTIGTAAASSDAQDIQRLLDEAIREEIELAAKKEREEKKRREEG